MPPLSAPPADVVRILELLEDKGFQARLIGGCVRDRLLGRPPKDWDVATDATPDEIIQVFTPWAHKVLLIGKAFGTVGILRGNALVEITTLRRDVSCDGRAAEVEFSHSFEEDAARRDFTINALSEGRDGVIHDYFEGRIDLNRRVLRFIGEPLHRIQEDYLRILRYFRFQAQLGFSGEAAASMAIAQAGAGLAQLSAERITQELRGMWRCPTVAPQVEEMERSGILGVGIYGDRYALAPFSVDLVDGLEGVAPEQRFLARLGILSFFTSRACILRVTRPETHILQIIRQGVEKIPASASDIATQMRFLDQCEAHGNVGVFQALLYPIWKVLGQKPEALAALHQVEQIYGGKRRQPLPITGSDLGQELGMESGAPMGRLLGLLQDSFRRGEWETRAEGLEKARVLRGAL